MHNNVPYRTEEVEILQHDPSDLDLTGVPAVEDLASGTVELNPPTTHWDQAALDCEHLCLPCMGAELDEPVTVSDLPVDMPAEEVVSDPFIGKRVKTRAQLIAEATSSHHIAGHYPHNPF